jgi:3-hydroxyacyl-CoA dehydrogenase
VIRGFHTSEATLARAFELLALMGKEGIVVNDMPGFVTNRVLMLTINEAIFVVQDQVAPHEDVDRLFKTCFGHKMGPLETGDLIGLDTILYSLEVLCESYNDDKYRPCPLLRKMVDAGLYGRKSGPRQVREHLHRQEGVPLGREVLQPVADGAAMDTPAPAKIARRPPRRAASRGGGRFTFAEGKRMRRYIASPASGIHVREAGAEMFDASNISALAPRGCVNLFC